MNLSERNLMYEKIETSKRLIPNLPIIIRLDGRSFHTFTSDLDRPDSNLTSIMIEVTKYLVQETNAKIGYTQSDEITLILFSDNIDSQTFFDRKYYKLLSITASLATAKFNNLVMEYLPNKIRELAIFDCRVYNVPSKEDAINVLLWRESDATRNSISMLAQDNFSHRELQNKSTLAILEMLYNKRIYWYKDYPTSFKRGTYIYKKISIRKFTQDELETLPELHNARSNPDLEIERSDVIILDIPPISEVSNMVDVVFNGSTPITRIS